MDGFDKFACIFIGGILAAIVYVACAGFYAHGIDKTEAEYCRARGGVPVMTRSYDTERRLCLRSDLFAK